MDFFSDYSFYTLFFLAAFAFIAGFLDAIVGGGGLIQLPALLIQFPQLALPTLFGTNKIAEQMNCANKLFRELQKQKLENLGKKI